ncbi:hypothetical protein ABNF97_15515 [Plantactinospora sp. B6F1]|uniref:hypothetical protein n=1 Tax=Plantactinospora sp. B6F1 TaxID=3158971 RepID=UPI0032D8EDC4
MRPEDVRRTASRVRWSPPVDPVGLGTARPDPTAPARLPLPAIRRYASRSPTRSARPAASLATGCRRLVPVTIVRPRLRRPTVRVAGAT